MSLRARATVFCVCSFYRTIIRKVPHKSVVIRRKVPHKNVKYLFLSLIISIDTIKPQFLRYKYYDETYSYIYNNVCAGRVRLKRM